MQDLVDEFTRIALDQDRALALDDTSRFNRLYDELDDVRKELKRRPGDQRSALIPLYRNPNAQVRLQAAFATLAVSPHSAREVLQRISHAHEYPQAADARGMLTALDDGSYVAS